MIPSLSASASDQTSQTASQRQELGSSGSSGFRSSVVNNLALGGSKLDAATGDGGVPIWAWVAIIGGVVFLCYFMLRRRHA